MTRSPDHKLATYSILAFVGSGLLLSIWWLIHLLQISLESSEILFWRVTLAAFLLLGHALMAKRLQLPDREIGLQWLGSVIFGFGTVIALVLSWHQEQWLFHLLPLLAALLWLMLTKHVTTFLIALSLAISSAVSIFWGFDALWLQCLRFGVGVGIGLAVYMGLGYGLSERFRPITLAGIGLLLPSLMFAATVPNSDKSLLTWLLLGLLALISSYPFYALYRASSKHLGLSNAWITSTAEPMAFLCLSFMLIPSLLWLTVLVLAVIVATIILSEGHLQYQVQQKDRVTAAYSTTALHHHNNPWSSYPHQRENS